MRRRQDPALHDGFPAPAGMDPRCGRPRRARAWIPRTRGDGPVLRSARARGKRDSPHPRGWTSGSKLRFIRPTGFPAPAGMDRCGRRRRPHRSGIPRTRGDGPRARRTMLLRGGGFPAPAGMDPARRRRRRRRRRIPRTRGDGPPSCASCQPLPRDSPHPRGWTFAEVVADAHPDGFPAPAGMDPGPSTRWPGWGRIPRTRGDGPIEEFTRALWWRDSPHPRGWTRVIHHPAAPDLRFPAPAGMDRDSPAGRASTARIPRTRGDGPRRWNGARRIPADSPHPRGWTPRVDLDVHVRRGFPAPAGMDPGRPKGRSTGARIPRTRGDGPRLAKAGDHDAADSPHPRGWTRADADADANLRGFPAPAGMDPGDGVRRGRGAGIPRTRGDGPSRRWWPRRRPGDSPHPRGWTLAEVADAHPDRGFPAPAGMDPPPAAPGPSGPRIPRTRGDGPSGVLIPAEDVEDSPHPRGWTRRASP